ncbi:MAG: glycosyltransferase [Actinomycetia bacterium]|nr:glycosyltransferase [Actinomycetes bacterium]
MRILHFTDSFAPRVGGIERQVANLVRHQRAAGDEVAVVTAVPGPPIEQGIEVIRMRPAQWRVFGSPLALNRLTRRGLAVARAEPRADTVLHVHMSVASPLAMHAIQMATRRAIPVAVTVHSMWPSSKLALFAANLPYWNSPMRATWSAVSTVASRQVGQLLPRVGPIAVVPNLVDAEWWCPPSAEAMAEALPAASGAVHLVTVGRLAKRKRVGPLLSVLEQVRARLPESAPVDVTIVGEGNRRAELTGYLREHRMADWVRMPGQFPPERIRSLLHQCDVFVAPAHRESFGIAALEARCAGLPVVGFRDSGLADFITDGVDGLLVGDDAELVDALTALASDGELRRRLRRTALREPPAIDDAVALRAVERLYQRALGGADDPTVAAPELAVEAG